MLPEKLREYFSFSKKERTGILVLTALIIIIFILPYFFSAKKPASNQQQFEQFKNEIAQLKTQQDSVHTRSKYYEQDEKSDYDDYTPSRKNTNTTTGTLFYFDPNTATDEEWKKLGIRDKTIQTIGHYLSKGGKFHKPEDLKKIYGLSEEKYDQLLPYIQFKNADTVASYKKTETNFVSELSFKKGKTYSTIHINAADTSTFSALPGIGSKLSNRIILFREKLGGFYSTSQVAEIYGLPDSTFLKLKPYLITGDVPVKKINVNTADANLLKQHPYIKWNLANAIVQYRQQHGDFKTLDELQNIALITPEVFAKISPYLEIK
jgi:competence protein ComEA